jgi:hypothetical protein
MREKRKVKNIAYEYIGEGYTVEICDDYDDEYPLIIKNRNDLNLLTYKEYAIDYIVDHVNRIVYIIKEVDKNELHEC